MTTYYEVAPIGFVGPDVHFLKFQVQANSAATAKARYKVCYERKHLAECPYKNKELYIVASWKKALPEGA
jgi:hypothetical protein